MSHVVWCMLHPCWSKICFLMVKLLYRLQIVVKNLVPHTKANAILSVAFSFLNSNLMYNMLYLINKTCGIHDTTT